MDIVVSAGAGSGSTGLAAFDAALFDAGVGNYNLIVLSSSIPPGAIVAVEDGVEHPHRWGDRVYVVMAEMRAVEPGEAWAGLGWVQDEVDGSGLFVEHHGESQQYVESQIEMSLASMSGYRLSRFGPVQMHVRGATCTTDPAAAVVVAVYAAAGWA